MSTILVTGASGHVGSRVAELLVERGRAPRRLMRDPAKARLLDGSTVVAGDYGDRASLDAAMRGIDTVFLVSANAPPLARAKLHGTVMDAAAAAGVTRLVYLSFQGASATSPFPYSADHLLSEAHLRQSGLAWTILRDSFYQELIPGLADKDNVIRSPDAGGKVAWIAREDVTQVAADVLVDERHAGKIYELTGPEALSLEEAVARLAREGQRLRYVRESLDEGRAWRAATGAPEWEVDVWLGSYLAMGTGELARLSTAVKDITGHEPRLLGAG
ncbi:SDR family oxidoreductase [Xanthomonas arboricola]|uniref:SDR family oxidoreductase n=1 Tax=Xanthomonas arboricola TaxID=56448 RepID=UPI000C86A0C7|nr:SDR family oxidoreductase [Xanthomonas arboricola]PMR89106.1 NAD(P)-dependent oxidoreductase [Xanthomonas arboricola pv. juglandis]